MHSSDERVRPPRSLTAWEAAAVGRLALPELAPQLSRLEVYERCRCGCASASFVPELQAHYPASELEGRDADGTEIDVILYTDQTGAIVRELEVMRIDGQPILVLPDPAGPARRTVNCRWPPIGHELGGASRLEPRRVAPPSQARASAVISERVSAHRDLG